MQRPSLVGSYINSLAAFLQKSGKHVAIWDLPTVASYYDKSLLIFRWNFEGPTSKPLWGKDGFQYINSPHSWYIVPLAPATYNPNGIPGKTLYDSPDDSINPGDLPPIGGQLANWNDKNPASPYSEASLNHVLKDSVPAFGQTQWSGQDIGVTGQVTPFSAVQKSIGTFQYGPGVTLFAQDPLSGSTCVAGDLAAGAQAIASGNDTTYQRPNLVTDCDSTTRWAGKRSLSAQWIHVDLGATQTVSRVTINFQSSYASQYQIQVSPDAVNWTTVANVTTDHAGPTTTTFAPASARYVKMLGVARALPQYGVSIYDFNVFASRM